RRHRAGEALSVRACALHPAPGTDASVPALRRHATVHGLVRHAPGVRAVRPPLRAGAGLLGGRDLRELRRDDGHRGRRVLPDVSRVVDDRRALRVGRVRRAVSAVVLSLRPQSLAGRGVSGQSRAVRLWATTVALLVLLAPVLAFAAYEEIAVKDGGTLTGVVRFN